MVVGCSAVVWQYIWKARDRCEWIKVAFNIASSAIAMAASFAAYTAAYAFTPAMERTVILGAATVAYFAFNTGLIACVVALTE